MKLWIVTYLFQGCFQDSKPFATEQKAREYIKTLDPDWTDETPSKYGECNDPDDEIYLSEEILEQ